jgi:hypothetical protein
MVSSFRLIRMVVSTVYTRPLVNMIELADRPIYADILKYRYNF